MVMYQFLCKRAGQLVADDLRQRNHGISDSEAAPRTR